MFMCYMGFTLNNITMLGLILAIGIVIDDAVVVHENIFRHMEEDGMDAMEAAASAPSEIALAVLATSLSLVGDLPADRVHGRDRRPVLLAASALTVAFAMVMSLFVSFTLTPMLCSRFLKLDKRRRHGEQVGLSGADRRRLRLRPRAGRCAIAGHRACRPSRCLARHSVPIPASWASSSSPATTRANTRSPSPRPKATASNAPATLRRNRRPARRASRGTDTLHHHRRHHRPGQPRPRRRHQRHDLRADDRPGKRQRTWYDPHVLVERHPRRGRKQRQVLHPVRRAGRRPADHEGLSRPPRAVQDVADLPAAGFRSR